MAVRPLWGLAAAGNMSRSFLGRFPAVKAQLGPVYSTSFRLASRISNTLRAGTPVRTAGELQAANPILLCSPGSSLAQLITPALLAVIEWPRKSILICENLDEPEIAAVLRGKGAAVALLSAVPGVAGLFVVCGDRAALHSAKAAVRSLGAATIEVAANRLAVFQAALTLTGSLFTPLLETTLECLRLAGLDQPVASKTVDSLFQHSLRSFRRAGRKSWAGPIAAADSESVDAQHAALQAVRPAMAEYFSDAARFAFHLYQTFPELTRYDRARWRSFCERYPS